ncbi:putative protein disulfide-isomerase [Planoprotostelium fungivorum]|uniref:Thioredoxin domain-containing protein n=1 Tax=Planoprotostelium fungivorum TaxID=1890364 RepID=A0A2P6N6Z5_9EUKA|nr:putative protein disulfide-isomerase [Planoprotostelium fungivorum]
MKSHCMLLLFPLFAFVIASPVVTLTEENFDDLTSDGNWFIDLYAPWCGHCKRLDPIWERLAHELEGEVHLGKIDATEHSALGQRFNLRGYPTLRFLTGGDMIEYKGGRTFEELREFAMRGYRQAERTSKPLKPTVVQLFLWLRNRLSDEWEGLKYLVKNGISWQLLKEQFEIIHRTMKFEFYAAHPLWTVLVQALSLKWHDKTNSSFSSSHHKCHITFCCQEEKRRLIVNERLSNCSHSAFELKIRLDDLTEYFNSPISKSRFSSYIASWILCDPYEEYG